MHNKEDKYEDRYELIDAQYDIGGNVIIQLKENFYKNTYTVLIEYITNTYDADASYVKIEINRDEGIIIISDDGDGMSYDELKVNFLKVGNNRRKKSNQATQKGCLVTG